MSEDASAKPTLSNRIGAWSCRALCGLMKLANVRFIAVLGRGIGYLVWLCAPSRRRIVARNLRIVHDPLLRGARLRRMVRANMVRTSMNLACSIKTGLMNDREFERSITMEGADFFEESGMDGHTVISCIPHAGNWEILARIRPHFTRVEHFGSMYRRLNNPLLEKMVYDARTGYGCEMFSKEDGLRAVLKLARNGGLLGVLSDQFTQEGLFLPYFGKITGVTPLPALLYRRCKGKGKLIAVYTRNIALGRWQAVLDREIKLPEGCESDAAITMEINKALEACQKENILDGFWMHHRWKGTNVFAPQQPPEVADVARANVRFPFRIIVCLPERAEEALHTLPMLRALKVSRLDAQITVICPLAQRDFWAAQSDCVDIAVTSDEKVSAGEQLEADEYYRDGPYDYLFMLSENARVFRSLKRHFPLYISGFTENKLSRRFRAHFSRLPWGPPQPEAEDYLRLLEKRHELTLDRERLFAPLASRAAQHPSVCYIAPLSSLGSADRWPEERWAELVARLSTPATLLALPEQESEAQAMAESLGIACRTASLSELPDLLSPADRLYAVDGLIAQTASMIGVPGSVIMASRSAVRVYRPDSTMKPLFRHLPCHPCALFACDRPEACTSFITVDEMLSC